LSDRIDEARANGWFGEVQGLQISLDAARPKLVSLDRTKSSWRTRKATAPGWGGGMDGGRAAFAARGLGV
jgi:hypothetical protein